VTTGESQELADWLATTGKNLTEVYITHAHGDHFFGLNTVLDTFPKARAVALPELVPLLAEQATPEWMQIWNSFFPDQLFEKPVVPVALDKQVGDWKPDRRRRSPMGRHLGCFDRRADAAGCRGAPQLLHGARRDGDRERGKLGRARRDGDRERGKLGRARRLARVEELAQGEAVGGFSWSEFAADDH
jgi:hypothetical protein